MKVSMKQLSRVLQSYDFGRYMSEDVELDINIKTGDDPGNGDMVNVLTLSYTNPKDGESLAVELFPFGSCSEKMPRITTTCTKVFKV